MLEQLAHDTILDGIGEARRGLAVAQHGPRL